MDTIPDLHPSEIAAIDKSLGFMLKDLFALCNMAACSPQTDVDLVSLGAILSEIGKVKTALSDNAPAEKILSALNALNTSLAALESDAPEA